MTLKGQIYIKESQNHEQTCKIVATLGPAVEIRGGKKFGEDGYWGENLTLKLQQKHC